MQDVYKSIDEYNTDKEGKILIAFYDIIADMINNKKLNSILTEYFIWGGKLNISLVFITQSYFKLPKEVRLNSTHFFIMKIPNKRKFHQIPLNHSLTLKALLRSKKNVLLKNSLLVNDATLASDNPLRFKKIFSIYNKIMTINHQIKDE